MNEIADLTAAQHIDDRQATTTPSNSYPSSCCGRCRHGTGLCPTPQACLLAEDEPGVSPSWMAMTWTEFCVFAGPAELTVLALVAGLWLIFG